MMSKVKAYAEQLIQRIEPWLIKPAHFEAPQRICLSLNNNIVSILYVDKSLDNINILFNEDVEFDAPENLKIILSDIVKRYQLEHIPTYWLLSPDDYQLFFIDALPVKNNEFADALSWRLRGLINYPLPEAVTDYFLLPAKKNSANQPMVVAITARKLHLEKYIDIFSGAGMQLSAIDIPELALRNLAATAESDEKTTAFLYFYNNMAILNLTRSKTLYFTRRITIPNDFQNQPNFYENISLELLRYFDYFQSQWRFPGPARFYIASNTGNSSLMEELAKHLMIKLEPFPLSNVIVNQDNAAKLQTNALLCLGAVLRLEGTNVTAEY